MEQIATYFPSLESVSSAAETLRHIAIKTPLVPNLNYSKRFYCNLWLKREDLQAVRSYKIRGAYNKISSLSEAEKRKGIVCASAGNHAQGVAYSCQELGIRGTIYMPVPTPRQKLEQVQMFGGDHIEVVLAGDSYDDACNEAVKHCETAGKTFVHPFDDEKVIEGQATVALEILEQATEPIDYIFVPVGGGGLAAGICAVFSQLSPKTKIIGVEPLGAPSMRTSIEKGEVTELDTMEKFVDGAAVKRVGNRNFDICRSYLHDMVTVHEGKVCQIILDLYNRDAIIAEPAGALSLSALEQFTDAIKGKNVVCVISGSNNDITRTPEIKERALLYANLKHYFLVLFPQRAGALKEFVAEILGPEDDITHFAYSKKHSRENGPAVVGIELKRAEDLEPLVQRMKDKNFYGDYLNEKPDMFQFLI